MTQNVSTPGAVPANGAFDYDLPPADLSSGQDPSSQDTKAVAKDQAANVGQSAAGAGQHVAGVAKSEAQNVAGEAVGQAKDLLGQARGELTEQASQQKQRVADGLRSLSHELASMAEGNQEAGVATDLARQAADRTSQVAHWLEQHEPQDLLTEVKSFARQRPGAFLAIALGAGLAAGRLTRGLKDDSSSSSAPSTNGSAPATRPAPVTQVQPATAPYGDGFEADPLPVDPYAPPVAPTAGLRTDDVLGSQEYPR